MTVSTPPEQSSLLTLPGSDDNLFKKLWMEDRLRFGAEAVVGDAFDEATARLVCAAMRNRTRLLIVLPDSAIHRSSLLLASALLRDWFDRVSAGKVAAERERVLYFGNSVGIRDQLASATIAGIGMELRLAEVFRQRHIGRSGIAREARGATGPTSGVPLPEVVTVYAPVDPRSAFDRESPAWIALDVTGRAPWAAEVIEEAERRELPLVAWTRDRIPDWLPHARASTAIFRWPHRSGNRPPPDRRTARNDPLLLLQVEPITAESTVLSGEQEEQLSNCFRLAVAALARASGEASSQFYLDAVSLHWQYLRALESLSVPLALYESEAGHLWGVRRLRDLAAACSRFTEAAARTRPAFAAALSEAAALLEDAAARLADPPLWRAARDLALGAEPGTVLAFSSVARRRLFAYALLAARNVSEQELAARGVRLAALSELESLDPQPLRVISVGLPSAAAGNRALSLLSAGHVRFLLLPHQTGTLATRARQWETALGADGGENSLALACLGATQPALFEIDCVRIQLPSPLSIVSPSPAAPADDAGLPVGLPHLDPALEIARLFEEADEEEDRHVGGSDDSDSAASLQEAGQAEDLWCEAAIRLRFSDGWIADFAPEDRVTVVLGSGRHELEERYVRAVREGDVVLAMPGQRRQSLYALLVSRVHSHPAIQLHLTLLERWHGELAEAYARTARRDGWGVEDLLREIRARGSSITSAVTLYAWIRGAILCPLDAKDLLRVADALSMPFTREHHRRIHAAANRIRGIHRSLSHRIGRWLEQQLTGRNGADEAIDEVDAEWGLRFSDFRDSLLLLRTERAEVVPGPFLRARLGQFDKDPSQ
jgi:hypothetical protein